MWTYSLKGPCKSPGSGGVPPPGCTASRRRKWPHEEPRETSYDIHMTDRGVIVGLSLREEEGVQCLFGARRFNTCRREGEMMMQGRRYRGVQSFFPF